jgi:uncharacterized protein YukE
MQNVSFKIETEKVKKQAVAISTLLNDIDEDFKKISQNIKESRIFWQGEAGEKHQRLFKKVEEEAEELFQDLGKHSDHLLKITGVYEEKEKVALEIVENLSGSTLRIR